MLLPAAALMPCRQPAELARSASRAANADVNPKLMTIEWDPSARPALTTAAEAAEAISG
jgi:hypothetical protein